MYTLRHQIDLPDTTELRQLLDSMPAETKAATGRAATQLTKQHLYDLDNERHRENVPLHFYADAADAVLFRPCDDGFEIVIPKAGMAQRFYGGTITAINFPGPHGGEPLLWIPVAPESEGKSAGEFDHLIPIYNAATGKGVALQDGKVLFALVHELTQDPDPSVIPSDEEYETSIEEAIDLLLESLQSGRAA